MEIVMGTDEKVSIGERYARSVNSSSLRDDDLHHQTDVLMAFALSSDLGSALFRVKYANDHASLPDLVTVWRARIFKKALERGWAENAQQVADESLKYWLNDICPACDGKGHPKIINAPTLAACTCTECQGTGKLTLRCDERIIEKVKDAVQSLTALERDAGAAAIRKLSDEARF